jgi:sugar phosphate isomerase/epimerase
MRPEQIAISAATTWNGPLQDFFASCEAAGFRHVELPLDRIKPQAADQLRALLAHHQLRCIAGGSSTRLACFADAAAMAQNHAAHLAHAVLLSQLGGGVLVVRSDAPTGGERSFVALDAIGRTMVDLVAKMPADVSIALAFDGPAVSSLRSAKIACDAARDPRIGILFDTAHFHCSTSKLEDLTPAVVARIAHVRISDMPDRPGELCDAEADRLLPGEGALDLRGLLGRIESLGYRGFVSLHAPGDLRRAHAAMRRLL